jgi:hypothetical protein
MANALIFYIVQNEIILWTDGDPSDQSYSRRNVIEIGSQCAVLCGDFVPWIPHINQFLTDPNITSMPCEQLANQLSVQCQNLPNKPNNNFGIIVAGFNTQGVAAILGNHSTRNFGIIPFSTVVDGIPISIWNYLLSILQTIPENHDNVIDLMLIAGNLYIKEGLFRPFNHPAESTIVIMSKNSPPFWLPAAELSQRQEHNNRRLQALQIKLNHQLQGLIE